MIRGTLECGCAFEIDDRGAPPTCLSHRTNRVATVSAPAPRFSGVSGPHGDGKPLDAMPVPGLSPGGRMRLKGDRHG